MTAFVVSVVALGIALVAAWQVWLVAQQTAVLTARVDALEKDLGIADLALCPAVGTGEVRTTPMRDEPVCGIPSQCAQVHPEPPHDRCRRDYGHDGDHVTSQGSWWLREEPAVKWPNRWWTENLEAENVRLRQLNEQWQKDRDELVDELQRLREALTTLEQELRIQAAAVEDGAVRIFGFNLCNWANQLLRLRVPIAETAQCDHKFIDSTACVKCGWTPPKESLNGRD